MYSVFFSKIQIGFPIIKQRLKKIIKSNHKVVIIPWSFAIETDQNGLENYFITKIKDKYVPLLLELGIQEKNIKYLNCYSDNLKYMQDLIKNSDILVLTGGNPEMFYNKVVSCKLLDTIKKYNNIIIGSSAGAELQLKDYFITEKNNYYKKFDWYKGFGIINNPFYLDVHSINDANYLDQFRRISDDKKKTVYAIFDDGVILYNRENKKIEIYGQVLKFNPNLKE